MMVAPIATLAAPQPAPPAAAPAPGFGALLQAVAAPGAVPEEVILCEPSATAPPATPTAVAAGTGKSDPRPLREEEPSTLAGEDEASSLVRPQAPTAATGARRAANEEGLPPRRERRVRQEEANLALVATILMPVGAPVATRAEAAAWSLKVDPPVGTTPRNVQGPIIMFAEIAPAITTAADFAADPTAAGAQALAVALGDFGKPGAPPTIAGMKSIVVPMLPPTTTGPTDRAVPHAASAAIIEYPVEAIAAAGTAPPTIVAATSASKTPAMADAAASSDAAPIKVPTPGAAAMPAGLLRKPGGRGEPLEAAHTTVAILLPPPPSGLSVPTLPHRVLASPQPTATTSVIAAIATEADPAAPGFRVDSAALGRIDVALHGDPGQIASLPERLHVHFAVERSATAVLIAESGDRLNRALATTGARLESVSVAVQPRDENAQHSGSAPRDSSSDAPRRDEAQPPRRAAVRAASLQPDEPATRDRFA